MKARTSHAQGYAPLFPYLAVKPGGILAEGQLVIDNFAGIGGASTGMEAALGRPVDHAINHDPVAVSLHRVNHPHSHHSVEDVWQAHPLDVTGGQQVALAWFSPTCTHFSKAKGAALLDRKIRGLAWVALRWAALVRPSVIMLENVEEFEGWGPLLPDGRPDPKQKGRTFQSFVNALRYQGYQVEHRELRACDYGAPTIRKRLFLIARRDGLPIVWPAPTHAAPADPRVKAGLLQPYRTAAECIDWNLPTPSIFDRTKPLVRNTLNRVAQGLRRFVLESSEPFIVTCDHGGAGFRGQGLDRPFNTITAAHEAHGLVSPALAPCVLNKQHGNPARGADQPLSTVTTNHNKNELVQGYLVPRYGERDGQQARAVSVAQPSPTVVTTGNGSRLATVHLVQHNGGSLPARDASYPATRPARTVMAQGGRQDLVTGALIKTDNQRSRASCTYPLDGTTPTTVTKNNQALVSGALVGIDNASSTGSTWGANTPLTTIVTEARHALTTAHLTAYYGRDGKHDDSREVNAPLGTVPTVDRFSVTAATLMRQFGTSTAAAIDAPAPTVMTEGAGKTGVITVDCWPALSPAQHGRAREVHDFLLEFLGDALTPYSRDGLVVLQVRGEWYVLADIGMRMLTPRELARCQGFPEGYVLERTAEGKPISKARQVRGIGNSVCPQLAQALTHANLSVALQEAAD